MAPECPTDTEHLATDWTSCSRFYWICSRFYWICSSYMTSRQPQQSDPVPCDPVPTQLAEVQGGPVEASGAGRRQRSDTDSALEVQTPQSVPTRRQVSQLHLATQAGR